MKSVNLVFALALASVPAFANAAPPPSDAAAPAALASDAAIAAPAADAAIVAAPAVITPAPAATAGEPETMAEAISTGAALYAAMRAGDWTAVASLAIMILLFVLRKFWSSIPSSAMPWIAMGMGMLSAFSAALSSGASMGQAALSGLVLGTSAIGLWEAIFKRFLKPKAA
jgi:hypothetical protein